MVDAKKITIFRLTGTSDTSATDPLVFNDVTKKDTTNENGFILSLEKTDPEGLGKNQTAEKNDANIQPTGTIEGTWILTGFISNIHGSGNDGDNAFIKKLTEWKDEPPVNSNWPGGRFGIIDANDIYNSLAPVRTPVEDVIGLIFSDFKKTDRYLRNDALITLKFTRSRGLDV